MNQKNQCRHLLLGLSALFLAQLLASQPALYSAIQKAEEAYGHSDLLVNGTRYFLPKQRANGHPFFESPDYLSAQLFIKGDSQDGIPVKYDLEINGLVYDARSFETGSYPILLHPGLVDSFYLLGKCFINCQLLWGSSKPKGYVEKVAGNTTSGLYVLHRKFFKQEITQWNPHGVYLKQAPEYWLFLEKVPYQVRKNKDFLKIFPEQKTQIKKFLRAHKIQFPNCSTSDFKKLINLCNDIAS